MGIEIAAKMVFVWASDDVEAQEDVKRECLDKMQMPFGYLSLNGSYKMRNIPLSNEFVPSSSNVKSNYSTQSKVMYYTSSLI